jgi:hypothetical protein
MRLFALLTALLAPVALQAQAAPDRPSLHLGLGAAPGVGLFATQTTPLLTLFARDVAVYTNYVPGDEGQILLAAGVGAAVRVTRVLEVTGSIEPPAFDLDVGFRTGPAFRFALFEQTAASKARAFRLFADPYVRASTTLSNGRRLFAEIGPHDPSFRLGLVIGQ